jgi:hypothetical protein
MISIFFEFGFLSGLITTGQFKSMGFGVVETKRKADEGVWLIVW